MKTILVILMFGGLALFIGTSIYDIIKQFKEKRAKKSEQSKTDTDEKKS